MSWLWLIVLLLFAYIIYERMILFRVSRRVETVYKIHFSRKKLLLGLFDIRYIFRVLFRIMKIKSLREEMAAGKTSEISSDIVTLHNLTKQLIEIRDMNSLYKTIVETFLFITGAQRGSIAIYDKERDFFIIKYGSNINIENIDALTFKRGEGLIWKCAFQGQVCFVEDILEDKWYKKIKLEQALTRESMLLIPLKVSDEILGVVSLSIQKEYRDSLKIDKAVLESFAGICSAYIKNFQLLSEQVKNKILAQQIETSKKMQEGILQREEIYLPDYEVAYNMIPALQISGDFYVVRPVASGKGLIIALADVVGKGFSSAIMMAIAKIALEIYVENVKEPEEMQDVLKNLNNMIFKYIGDEEKFITLIMLYLDLHTGELYYINCGHTSPIIYKNRDEKFIWLREKGIALGFLRDLDEYVQIYRSKLEAGDFLFVYSDGVLDARNKENIFLEERGLLDILFYIRDKKGAQSKVEHFEKEIKRYMQIEPRDDITYVIAERKYGIF